MRCSRKASVFIVFICCLILAPLSLADRRVSAQAIPEQPVPPADEQAIKGLVARLYDARVKKDVPAFSALWHPKAPRRYPPTFPSEYIFPYERMEAGAAVFSRLALQFGTITARVAVPVTITERSSPSPRSIRWIRKMEFVKDGGEWRIYTEAPAADSLAVEIAKAPNEEARQKLVDSDPELGTEELALAIETQGDRAVQTGGASGLALYEFAARVGEKVGSVAAVARAHLKIGQMLQMKAGPKLDAIEHFQKALQGFTSLGDRGRVASAEIGLATSNYMQDDVAATEHYAKAIEILETLPDKFELARALHGYGNACFVTGNFGAALDAYNRSMALQEAGGSKAGIPSLLQAIAQVQAEQRDYDAALESYSKSLTAYGVVDQATQFAGLTGLADVYRHQGRCELALEQYGKALQVRSDPVAVATVEADIGNVYMTEQQPSAARAHYEKSLAAAGKDAFGRARALAGIGTALFAGLRYEEALDAFSQSLVLRESQNDKPAMAWTHAHIGMVQSALEKHDEALVSFQKALDLSNNLNDAAAVAVMETLLASEHADLGHPEQAMDFARKAAEIAKAIESDDTVAQARTVMAKVLCAGGDRAGAESALQEAVAAVESKRRRAGDEPTSDFFGNTRTPYRMMAILKSDAQQPAAALAFAERAHLDLLADVLAGGRSLITRGLTPEEQEEERRLNRARTALQAQIDKERTRAKRDAARLESLKSRLADVEQQKNALAEKIYSAHPMLKAQRGLFDAASTEQVAALIPDGRTAIIEFVTGEKQSVAIVIARAAQQKGRPAAQSGEPQITARTIDVTLLALSQRVLDFRALLRQRDAKLPQASRELYDLLIAPLSAELAGRTRVVIVPDGPLWALPFQALQSPDGRFLIERAAVSYAPSITALHLLASDSLSLPPAPSRRLAVAIGNQHAGSVSDRLKLLNPFVDVRPMPNAEQEARRVALAYGPARAKAEVGAAASADRIRSDAPAASLLHVATVFLPSAASPMHSPIVLAPKTDGAAEVIEAWELMAVDLPSFVLFSRVQADQLSREGHMPVGVTWPLFVGGARTAVVATWPDDSAGALATMTGLHRAMARASASPLRPARALQQAIVGLLAGPYRHPFYWANYAVIGLDAAPPAARPARTKS